MSVLGKGVRNRARVKSSRQTVSKGILQVAEDWLRPVYDRLRRKLVGRDALYVDESSYRCCGSQRNPPSSKAVCSFTGYDAKHPLCCINTARNRNAEIVAAFLYSLSVYLHTDSRSEYHKFPESIRMVGGLVHTRRKFDETVNTLPKGKQAGCAGPGGIVDA